MNTMLPSAPKSFGRLTEVLTSAVAAVGGRGRNSLGLRRSKKAVVILVDGLGVANIQYQPGHAPFLNVHLSKANSISCTFPSTTAASITSLATGAAPGVHSVIGYQVFDRSTSQPVNLLTGWSDSFPPSKQSIETISESCSDEAIDFVFCGPAEYENSGFTRATMRSARYLAAKTIEDRFVAVGRELAKPGPMVAYLYVPELDQTAHALGSRSNQWLTKLEELDGIVKRFTEKLPSRVGCLLTADHGIVDVAPDNHIFLDLVELQGLDFVGGDPRVAFLYFSQDLNTAVFTQNRSVLEDLLADRAYVATKEEVIAAGWYGPEQSHDALLLMPDLFVIARADVALYHRKFAKAKSLQMVGQHGSISPQEMKIPLLRFGQFLSD